MSAALPVILLGAGGHAAVLADALQAAGTPMLGHAAPQSGELPGLPWLGDDDQIATRDPAGVALVNGLGSVGDPALRRRVQARFEAAGFRFVGVVHPRAVVSPQARLAADAQVMAGAVVQAGARLDAGCIVNTGALVDHHAVLGPWCHVAPGAVVCGDVTLAERCHVGAGAVLRQGVRLGPATLVGAGAVVVDDCDGYAVLVGVPARPQAEGTKR